MKYFQTKYSGLSCRKGPLRLFDLYVSAVNDGIVFSWKHIVIEDIYVSLSLSHILSLIYIVKLIIS